MLRRNFEGGEDSLLALPAGFGVARLRSNEPSYEELPGSGLPSCAYCAAEEGPERAPIWPCASAASRARGWRGRSTGARASLRPRGACEGVIPGGATEDVSSRIRNRDRRHHCSARTRYTHAV